jgi:glycosyltransferase involved in cell wall biosynthesis
MKILFVSDVSQIGGGETAMEEIANSLQSQGHQLIVVQGLDRNQKNWSRPFLKKTIKTQQYRVDFRGNIRVYSSLIKGVWSCLSQISQENKIDAVLLNSTLSGAVVCIHPRFWLKRKIFFFHADDVAVMKSIFTSSTQKYVETLKKIPFYLIIVLAQSIVFLGSTYVVGFSRYSVVTMNKKFPFWKSKMKKIDPGVNTKTFFPLKTRKQRSESKIILCTSRFEKRKGIHLLIESFSQLYKKNPKLRLHLATSLDDYAKESGYYLQIKNRIKELHLTSIIKIHLNLQRNQLVQLYQRATIQVLPSQNLEAFGLVILEAFACGVPVVAYQKAGAPAEVIKKIDQKYIFAKYAADNLAKTLNWALKHSLSSKQKQTMKTIVKTMSWDVTAHQIIKLL